MNLSTKSYIAGGAMFVSGFLALLLFGQAVLELSRAPFTKPWKVNTLACVLLLGSLALPAAGQSPIRDSGTAQGPSLSPALVEEQPRVLSLPPLVYPKALRDARIKGRVNVQFILDTLGRAEPQSVTVFETTDSGFDQSAKDFVLAARFRPGRVHGRAVRVLLRVPVEFNVKDSTTAAGKPEHDSVTSTVQTAEDVYRLEDVEEQPELLTAPGINYPDSLRRAGVEGRVMVQFILDTLGRVEPQSLKVIETANAGFNHVVIEHMLAARFRPARYHGRAVRVLLKMPFDFRVTRQ